MTRVEAQDAIPRGAVVPDETRAAEPVGVPAWDEIRVVALIAVLAPAETLVGVVAFHVVPELDAAQFGVVLAPSAAPLLAVPKVPALAQDVFPGVAAEPAVFLSAELVPAEFLCRVVLSEQGWFQGDSVRSSSQVLFSSLGCAVPR